MNLSLENENRTVHAFLWGQEESFLQITLVPPTVKNMGQVVKMLKSRKGATPRDPYYLLSLFLSRIVRNRREKRECYLLWGTGEFKNQNKIRFLSEFQLLEFQLLERKKSKSYLAT